MRPELSSFLDRILQRRVVQALLVVASIVLIGWVTLVYAADVTLSGENGDSRPLVTMALVVAGLLVATLIAWRRGVRLLWIIGLGGLAALIQLLVLFL